MYYTCKAALASGGVHKVCLTPNYKSPHGRPLCFYGRTCGCLDVNMSQSSPLISLVHSLIAPSHRCIAMSIVYILQDPRGQPVLTRVSCARRRRKSNALQAEVTDKGGGSGGSNRAPRNPKSTDEDVPDRGNQQQARFGRAPV